MIISDDQDEIDDEGGIINRILTEVSPNDRSVFPYNCICRLKMKYKSQQWMGTAFLVSPDEAITAAHNNYYPKKKILSQKTLLYVYQNGYEQEYEILAFKINERYTEKISTQDKYIYDYCLIKLQKKITSINKFLEIEPNFGLNMEEKELADCRIGICGFPVNSDNKMMHCYYQNSVQEITDHGVLKHLLPTFPGHSGCPILYKRGQMVTVIGIHKGGLQNRANRENVNYGLIFSKVKYDTRTEILWDLSKWSTNFSQNSLNILNNSVLKNLPKKEQLIFCDPKTRDFNDFQYENHKITLKEGQSGWKRLFSKRKICFKNCIQIKNIFLPVNATICFGFVNQIFKKTQSTCKFSGFKKDYIGMMITSNNNVLHGDIGISNSFNKTFIINQEEDLLLKINLGKLSDNPQSSKCTLCLTTKKEKEHIKERKPFVQINLKDYPNNFAEDMSYYFYVSMYSSGTSVEILM